MRKYARVFVGADKIGSRRVELEQGIDPAKFEQTLNTDGRWLTTTDGSKRPRISRSITAPATRSATGSGCSSATTAGRCARSSRRQSSRSAFTSREDSDRART